MHQKIWASQYEVNSFLVSTQRRLGLYALLNILQDVAWKHATHLGHGYESVFEKKMTWVLTRQKVVMTAWPKWGEWVEIKTWLRPMQAPFVVREFEIFKDGKVIGAASASWLMIDIESRRPLKRGVTELETEFRTDYQLSFEAPKIEPDEHFEEIARYSVRNSDLDLNEHVNNTRYAQWILDSLPLEWHRKTALQEYDVNFIAETRAGDQIVIRKSLHSDTSGETRLVMFDGWREADQKRVFLARMKVVSGS